eukprot:14715541-Alexandrium_andersonii.AAC.1
MQGRARQTTGGQVDHAGGASSSSGGGDSGSPAVGGPLLPRGPQPGVTPSPTCAPASAHPPIGASGPSLAANSTATGAAGRG